jgi:hypothetical protein
VLARYSDIVRRIQTLRASDELPSTGLEAPKPDYQLTWPKDLSETDPDIARKDLPVSLAQILGDLDRIQADLKPVDAELAVTSFLWMVKDGLKLDPVRNRMTWELSESLHVPVALSRPRAAGELPEPGAEEVHAGTRHRFHRCRRHDAL